MVEAEILPHLLRHLLTTVPGQLMLLSMSHLANY